MSAYWHSGSKFMAIWLTFSLTFINYNYFRLTDFGGSQEEAPPLEKTVLVMCDTTERLENVAAGTLKLVGTEETIYNEFSRLLSAQEGYRAMSQASNPCSDAMDMLVKGLQIFWKLIVGK